MSEPSLPTGAELDAAIVEAKAGRLPADRFAAALDAATLLLAVTDRTGETSATPFVVQIGGADHGVAFTGPRHHESFGVTAPCAVLRGRDLMQGWPDGLGLAVNPGADPSIVFSAAQLAALFETVDAHTVVPAGSSMRVGAPDPGLPPHAVDLLRRLVASDPSVRAAYQLAVGVEDGPVELVVGVEPEQAGGTGGGADVARRFADRVAEADAGFRGLPFLDLDGWLLDAAREHGTPLA